MFLPYLDELEDDNSSDSDKDSSYYGIQMTGLRVRVCVCHQLIFLLTAHSFTEMTEYLFTIPGVKVFLSGHINQDPIEKLLVVFAKRAAVVTIQM